MRKIDEAFIRDFISRHGIEIKSETGTDPRLLNLKSCPFCGDASGNPRILIYPDGGVQFKEHRNTCQGKTLRDFIQHYEPEFYKKAKFKTTKTKSEAAEIHPRKLNEVEEKPVKWLVPGYIPEGQIVVLGGDGETGKSTVWADLLAGVTTGRKTLFDEAANVPFEEKRDPENVLFFSGEDTAAEIIKSKFRNAGADMNRVYLMDLEDEDSFDQITFDSEALNPLMEEIRPKICVFDPIQQFIPEEVQLASRNQMRRCLRNVASLGKKYNCVMLLIAHTNKKSGVWGRKRLADSGDIYDFARCVMFLGMADEEKRIRYIAHDKSNFSEHGETILFTIDGDGVHFYGTTKKTDRDYVIGQMEAARPAPARDDTVEMITELLKDGELHEVKDVEAELKNYGISAMTIRRAKEELRKCGVIRITSTGFGKEKKWYMRATIVPHEEKNNAS